MERYGANGMCKPELVQLKIKKILIHSMFCNMSLFLIFQLVDVAVMSLCFLEAATRLSFSIRTAIAFPKLNFFWPRFKGPTVYVA